MTLLFLTLAALGTAILSGIFGMAGGLVLMGVYTALLPVEAAMVLHGLTQLLANGLRAGLHARQIDRRGLALYALGAGLAWAILRVVAYVPDAKTVYLLLGALPIAARLAPRSRWLTFAWAPAATLAGFLVAGLQMIAGVAGPVLDLFFLDRTLDRHAVVGTKAATQTLSHFLKIGFFYEMVPAGTIAPVTVGAVLVGAAVGTVIGTAILNRWSNEGFQTASRWLVLGIGIVYLGWGLSMP